MHKMVTAFAGMLVCANGSLAASAVAVLISSSALAADLGGYSVKDDRHVGPGAKWTGLYIGVHGGYGWGQWDGSQIYTDAALVPAVPYGAFNSSSHSIDASGAIGGGQIGFNIQSGGGVWGIEADASWSGIQGDAVLFPYPNDPARGTAVGTPAWGWDVDNKWLATVRGRLGFAAGSMFIYGTGGVAFGGFDITHTVIGYPDPEGRTSRRSDTKVGWTAGVGAEWAVARNWTLKAEYLYLSFSDVGGITSGWLPLYGPPTDGFKGDLDLHTAKLGLNYKF